MSARQGKLVYSWTAGNLQLGDMACLVVQAAIRTTRPA